MILCCLFSEKVSHSPGWPSYLLCKRGWSWTPYPVTSTGPALEFEVCATIPGMASVWRISFSISCRTGMVEICSLSFCLPEKNLCHPFISLKKGFPGHSFLNWQDISFFSTVQLLCHSLLTCAVSAKKYVVVRIRYHYLLFLFSCGFE